MFKANLIANPAFAFFRKHSLFLSFLLILVNSFFINILLKEGYDWSMLLMAMPAYLLLYYFIFKLGLKVVHSIQNRQLELDGKSITVYNKTGQTDLQIPISSVESIVLQKDYKYEESFGRELFNHIKGISNYHFIQVYSENNWYTFRFMLDSHYMESKLNTCIQEWLVAGTAVQYSNKPISDSKIYSGLDPAK